MINVTNGTNVDVGLASDEFSCVCHNYFSFLLLFYYLIRVTILSQPLGKDKQL